MTALVTVIDLGLYVYHFRMHLLLLELSIFWKAMVELHTGANLCRIMILSNPKPTIPRGRRRDIIFRGTTAIHMSSLIRDNPSFTLEESPMRTITRDEAVHFQNQSELTS